jgi:hypothetical protein
MLKTLFYAKYIGASHFSLVNGNIYSVVEREDETHYFVVDETDCDYLYSINKFEILKENEVNKIDKKIAEKRVERCNKLITEHGRGNF